MPTTHYISSEMFKKHFIDRLPPGEMKDDPTGSSSNNKRSKMTTTTANVNLTHVETHGADNGATAAKCNDSTRTTTANSSSIMQPLSYKSTGNNMDSINNDDECKKNTDQSKAYGSVAIPSLHEGNNEQGIMNNVDDERKPSAAIQTDCDSTSCFSSEGDDDTLSAAESSDDDEPSKEDIERAMKQQSKIIHDEMYDEIFLYDKQYELCCIHCHCNPPCPEYDSACIFKEVLPSQTSPSSYYVRMHRWCCTNIPKKHSLDVYDQEYAITNYGIAIGGGCREEKAKNGIFHVNNSFLLKAKKNANTLKTVVDNNIYKDPCAWRWSDIRYTEHWESYKVAKGKANLDGLKAANVLSLFSGIGAGILVLKRLKIAINNCVVVEHDAMAELVCAANHKTDVNEYIWIKTFEELEQTFDTVMTKYGPFDIVEGGPPCTEYSVVNANRSGMKSVKGQYMLKFAQLIKRIKNHPKQNGHHVFFLCENVESMKDNDVKEFEDDFGISRVNIDALCLSPTKRARSYFTNIPMNELPAHDSAEALSAVDFLTDGWMDPARLYSHIHNEPVAYSKAYTFMASPYRIDHKERMIKVRLHDDRIEATQYTVEDREMLLGFPKGYVECVVKRIFERVEESFEAEDWFANAQEKVWDLDELISLSARSYKFFLCSDSINTKLSLKLGTVEKLANDDTKSLYHYDSDGYCKRLLGNSYSIPVVEHILRPLCDLFLKKQYNNADYCFAWQSDNRS